MPFGPIAWVTILAALFFNVCLYQVLGGWWWGTLVFGGVALCGLSAMAGRQKEGRR